MAVHGFVTQAARNRRLVVSLAGAYLVAFLGMGLFALSPIDLFIGNAQASLFVEPLGYALRIAPWILLLALASLGWNLRVLQGELTEVLAIVPVDARREARFLRIAEEQCILQGLRLPRFGVIDVPARNAVTVGALAGRPLIAVTRGLLDALDDDEVAAVVAHEIAHFRVGDARLIAFNYALMRTATALQAFNPLRVRRDERHHVQWHMVVVVFLPIILVYMLLGGLFTMLCWKLARFADGRVRAGRDLIADGEAIRFTHFPEALECAIGKCVGHGYFTAAERVEAMLFEGAAQTSGGTHADPAERIAALRRHAHGLYMSGRSRRDTRSQAAVPVGAGVPGNAAGFGRRVTVGAARSDGFALADRRGQAPVAPRNELLTMFTDPPAHRRWRRAALDHLRWRVSDRRNVFGFTPDMTPWVVGSLALSSAFLVTLTGGEPAALVELASGRYYFAELDAAFAQTGCSFEEAKDACLAREMAPIRDETGVALPADYPAS